MGQTGKPRKRSAPWKGRPRVSDPKSRPFPIRFSEAQFALLTKKAARSGLSIGAFSRTVLLGNPGPRSKRKPHVEKALLATLLGEIGKTTSNVNQIAHHANAARAVPVLAEIRLMKRDLAVMRRATLNTLGFRA